VKPIAGSTMVFDADESESADNLKERIARRVDIPAAELRISWGGKDLRGTGTLAELGVHSGATLFLLLRLRGGAGGVGSSGGACATGHAMGSEPENRCLVNALRALGAPIVTSDVGPFFAIHDGNAMLAPHGLVLRHVLEPTLGRFIIWQSSGTSVGHFVAFTVGAAGVVLYDGQRVRRFTSVAALWILAPLGAEGGDVMVYQLFSRPVKPDRLTAEQWDNIQLNRENALKLHRLRRCQSIKPADLLSLYLNQTHALAANCVNPMLHLNRVHRHARDDFIEFVEASHTYVLHGRFQFPISVSGVWLSW